MNKTKGFLLAAMALAFSCSSNIELELPPGNEAGSSSSEAASSSSVDGSSSSSVAASSSSSSLSESSSGGAPSSSSVETGNEPSSSSDVPSSSSVVPSSGSVEPSSSSALPSSSSVAPSSGSVGGLCAGFVKGTKRLHYEKEKEQFCDERDGKEYVYVVIGTQTWMAENLNYNATGSKCYDNLDSNCDTYGRMYNWETAMKACPAGWHLPTQAEWEVMTAYIGGERTEGKKLKAKSGWNSGGNCTDDYSFSALPGGGGRSGGSFYDVGYVGDWWIASKYSSNDAYTRRMHYSNENAHWGNGTESYLFSVRCLQD